jgi:hypothetical protein
MASWHFLKQLTCTLAAYSTTVTTLSRRLIRFSSLPVLSNHHKLSYQWLRDTHINILPARFSTASSSTAPATPAPYLSVLIHCPKHTAVSFSFVLFLFSLCIIMLHFKSVIGYVQKLKKVRILSHPCSETGV